MRGVYRYVWTVLRRGFSWQRSRLCMHNFRIIWTENVFETKESAVIAIVPRSDCGLRLENQSDVVALKPVLNRANVCSPNILRTLRRTMIRFLIELLVRRIWFGQSKLYFVLNWLVMRCMLRPELAAERSRRHDKKCRLKSSQYTLIIPHRVIQLTTISFWVSETRLRLPQVNK